MVALLISRYQGKLYPHQEWDKPLQHTDLWIAMDKNHALKVGIATPSNSLPPKADIRQRFAFGYAKTGMSSGEAYDWLEIGIVRYVFAPIWAFALMAAVLPLTWLVRMSRIRRRIRLGLCAICGYDLRATPDRCPECGTVPASSGNMMP